MDVIVITALTAQNTSTTGVQGGIHPCTAEFVANQVRKPPIILVKMD